MNYLNSNYDFEITGSILDYYDGKDENVAVPDFINIISDYTFCDNKHIKNVFIPDSVTEIYEDAFSGCVNLEKIELSKSIKKLIKDYFLIVKN